jgi:hypothetical protein
VIHTVSSTDAASPPSALRCLPPLPNDVWLVYQRRRLLGPVTSTSRTPLITVPVHAPGPVGPPLPPGAVPITPVENQHGIRTRNKSGFRVPALFETESLSPIPWSYRAALANPNW